MKRFGMSICALVFLATLNHSCIAQDSNAWNGSWKADASSVKYDGATMSVATDADGYTVTRDGKAMPKVVCDGQPKSAEGGLMTTCTKTAHGYDLASTKDGKQVRKGDVTLSSDGSTMTRKMEFFPADEDPYTMSSTSKRVSGGPGASGEWKEVSFNESADTGILSIAVTGDSIAFKETDRPKPVTGKLDGTETKTDGNSSVSMKLEDSHTLKVTYRVDGKVRRENTFVLSEDGKTIEETDITPEPSPSKFSMMFHKS
jgi:translation initiation factor IF-1